MENKWKLTELKDARDRRSLGNKAVGLGELKRAGFRVPGGFVLPASITRLVLASNGMADAVEEALNGLEPGNTRETAEKIRRITQGLTLPRELIGTIADRTETGRLYAVRSSGTLEDLEEASFAGQYESFLNVPVQELPERVAQCIRSLWQEHILSYLVHRGLDPALASMAVIIQDMVAADLAGVLFSIDPNTGADTQVVIEAVPGLGNELVSGRADPERFRYDWYEDRVFMPGEGTLLTRGQVRILAKAALKIQKLYGHPVDVEFAVRGGRNYALQTRPVTRVNYAGLKDQWTTADFKDGGVSATVSKPLMLSLYEYVWERELKRFILESHILSEKELRKLSMVRFGRMYWNLSVVKSAMAKVPGYRERQFDAELGIESAFEGEGAVTGWTPASGARLLRIALAQKKIRRQRTLRSEDLKAELLAGYDSVLKALDDLEGKDLKAAWIRLVRDLYLKSEGIYFWQIFINTIHMGMARDAILARADLKTYYDLIGGITNISHLRPFYDLWDLSRRVRADESALAWWLGGSAEELVRALGDETRADHFLPDLRQILARYEYHSERELDISWPDFSEDPAPLIAAFQDTLRLDASFSPEDGKRKVHQNSLDALAQIGRRHGEAVRSKIGQKAEEIRTMLWWREEFRDLSTRYYHLIRLYSQKLAQLLMGEGFLADPEDIWFLTKDDLLAILDERLSPDKAAKLIRRNRDYYDSFRNFQSDNEIGEGVAATAPQSDGGILLAGLPGSSGRISGRARVIGGLEEIDRIRPGDILVTRFTDTGWTSKFALLGGVITEFGGALCHAAIVSREYGIPCIVGAKGAMELIRDGEIITMDGASGEIRKEDASCSSENTTDR